MRLQPLTIILPLFLAAGMAQAPTGGEPFRNPNLLNASAPALSPRPA